jgi:hypothetical protein
MGVWRGESGGERRVDDEKKRSQFPGISDFG